MAYLVRTKIKRLFSSFFCWLMFFPPPARHMERDSCLSLTWGLIVLVGDWVYVVNVRRLVGPSNWLDTWLPSLCPTLLGSRFSPLEVSWRQVLCDGFPIECCVICGTGFLHNDTCSGTGFQSFFFCFSLDFIITVIQYGMFALGRVSYRFYYLSIS